MKKALFLFDCEMSTARHWFLFFLDPAAVYANFRKFKIDPNPVAKLAFVVRMALTQMKLKRNWAVTLCFE